MQRVAAAAAAVVQGLSIDERSYCCCSCRRDRARTRSHLQQSGMHVTCSRRHTVSSPPVSQFSARKPPRDSRGTCVNFLIIGGFRNVRRTTCEPLLWSWRRRRAAAMPRACAVAAVIALRVHHANSSLTAQFLGWWSRRRRGGRRWWRGCCRRVAPRLLPADIASSCGERRLVL